MAETDPEIVAALLRGNKIEAIKLYRARHPEADLLAAKREIERIERELPPGSIPERKGCARSAAALVLALAAVVLWACR